MTEVRVRAWHPLLWVVVLVAAFVVVVVGASPSYADEEPPPPESSQAYDPWYNGCNVVPDHPGGYNFTDACNWHDLCYGGHIADHSKSQCDGVFLDFMNTICQYWYGGATSCYMWAGAYGVGVGVFGWWHWYTGRDCAMFPEECEWE